MSKAIYMVPTAHGTGLTSVALGLVHTLDRLGIPVGFFKPVAAQRSGNSSNQLAHAIANLTPPSTLGTAEVEKSIGQGREDELLEQFVARYEEAAKDAAVVVVEGLVPRRDKALLANLNLIIPQSLDADIILVTAAGNSSPEQLQETLEIAAQPYGGLGHERLPGCILTLVGAPLDQSGRLRFDYSSEDAAAPEQSNRYADCPAFRSAQFRLLGAIPWQRELIRPRVRDIIEFFPAAKVLNEGDMNRRVDHIALGARSLANGCEKYRPGALIITPGDRDDILLAACMAALNGVHIAALLLTSDLQPHPDIMRLCRPGLDTGLPVIAVPDHLTELVFRMSQIEPGMPADDHERVQKLAHTVASHLDLEWIGQLLARTKERRLSPPAFRYQLTERARQANKRIVLPEGDEPRTIEAAVECQRRGIARCVLLGQPETIRQSAARQGVELPPELEILDPKAVIPRYIEPMVELRKNKGLTAEVAEEQLQDNVVMGTMMLQTGEVDGLVSGAVSTTANTIRPALQLIKTAPGAKLVSSVFFMCLPEQVLVYGDCAVNPNPDAEALADIAIQSAASAKAFGIEPRVAMLSYSTGASGSGSDVETVREATRIAKTLRPDLLIDGPLQYDAAAIATVARSKAPDSQVAGRATVFIFPDLNTGNTTYKAVQRSADVISIGPMLQGLRKPVNDLSRGALVEDIVFTIALTAIQARQTENLA